MAILVISYSRADQTLVRAVVTLLKSATRDVERAVFWDADIEPGDEWWGELQRHIDRAPQLFVFWCDHSSRSTEVKREFIYALGRGKRVVPVLLDDTPLSSELASINGIDLRQAVVHPRASPVNASPRRRMAWLRLWRDFGARGVTAHGAKRAVAGLLALTLMAVLLVGFALRRLSPLLFDTAAPGKYDTTEPPNPTEAPEEPAREALERALSELEGLTWPRPAPDPLSGVAGMIEVPWFYNFPLPPPLPDGARVPREPIPPPPDVELFTPGVFTPGVLWQLEVVLLVFVFVSGKLVSWRHSRQRSPRILHREATVVAFSPFLEPGRALLAEEGGAR